MTSTLLIIGIAVSSLVLLQLFGFTASRIAADWNDKARRNQQLAQSTELIESQAEKIEKLGGFRSAWNGWRSLRVIHTEMASADCKTFVFADPDGGPMPSFLPGQFLMVGKVDKGNSKPSASRCYSLSDAPSPSRLRITVKRVEGGLVSNWLHDHVQAGDHVQCRAPGGRFVLDLERDDLVVCLAAGVGVTPMASMAQYVAKMQPGRPIVVFLSARDSDHCPLVNELRHLAKANSFVTLVVLHSKPQAGDSFDIKGRLTIDVVQRVIGRPVGSYYLCGPMPFMTGLSDQLKDWGVPADSVSFESFGDRPPKGADVSSDENEAESFPIEFKQAGKTINFGGSDTSILDVAEEAGIKVEADCRAGACGTCITKLLKGKVQYDMPPSYSPLAKDECLACIAKPAGDCVVDA